MPPHMKLDKLARQCVYFAKPVKMGNIIHNHNHQMRGRVSRTKRFSLAMLASITVHVLFAMMITFDFSDRPIPKKKSPPVMDVVLLDESQISNDSSPSDARTIANKNSSGQQQDANDSRTRAARSPQAGDKQLPRKPRPMMPKQPKTPPVPQQQAKQNARILSREDDSSAQLLPPELKAMEEKKTAAAPVPDIPFANLLPPSAALTQLSREFDRERRMKQLMSKEADIGINTREAKYAPYAQNLVRSLEEQWQPGRENIEQLSANDRKVLMSVSIAHNGELAEIRMIQPSPSQALNDSAIAAVHAAAPFTPLPSSWGLERANFYFIFEVVEDRFVFRTL